LRLTLEKKKKKPFEGVHGFENTVIPELERAIYPATSIYWASWSNQNQIGSR
jgi:hypothetical protein